MVELVDFAISHDRFTLRYQPMLALSDPKYENYHVQLYLADADDQHVPATTFLKPAQQAGRLAEIDKWVISEMLPRMNETSPSGRPFAFHYAISSSAHADSGFVSWLHGQLRNAGVAPERITIVLNNDDVRHQLQKARELGAILGALGCRVMLDGLGGSLQEDQALIKHLPVLSGARFDAALSENLEKDPEQVVKLQQANKRLRDLGLATVMSEVNHAGALAQAWGIGVSFIQGDFLSPPLDQLDFDFSQY